MQAALLAHNKGAHDAGADWKRIKEEAKKQKTNTNTHIVATF